MADSKRFTIGAVVFALSFGKLYATFDAKGYISGQVFCFMQRLYFAGPHQICRPTSLVVCSQVLAEMECI